MTPSVIWKVQLLSITVFSFRGTRQHCGVELCFHFFKPFILMIRIKAVRQCLHGPINSCNYRRMDKYRIEIKPMEGVIFYQVMPELIEGFEFFFPCLYRVFFLVKHSSTATLLN